IFFFASRRRHTRWFSDWSSDVCSPDLWLQAWVPLLPITNWYPSGGALATRSEPTVPPAPLGFSTTTCWPRTSLNPCARMRPATSLGPPAANGTTSVSGRLGQFCAGAVPVAASSPSSTPKAGTAALIIRLLIHMVRPWLHDTSPARAQPTHYRLAAISRPSRSWHNFGSHGPSVRWRAVTPPAPIVRHVGVALSIVNNRP